jgi:hypothetical protein
MLVDHFIDFKGCDSADHIHRFDENDISMAEFIRARHRIFDEVPALAEPDFARDTRLPTESRNYVDDDDVEDSWEQELCDPLDHMTAREWRKGSSCIKELFSCGEDCKNLAVGKSDITFTRSEAKRIIARGQATIDIGSILAMFTDLSVIKTVIGISIMSNPIRNLKRSVHLEHKGAPLHHIPHFHLGQFGHDPKFDLYMMLPMLYHKGTKHRKGNPHNHVSEDIRAAFMDDCFLPAVEDVIGYNESQSWDFSYDVSKAKSTAARSEGNRVHHKRRSGFRQEIHMDLDAEHIHLVWRNRERRLRAGIRRAGKLRAFRGYQFFINSKGYKHRMKTGEFSS